MTNRERMKPAIWRIFRNNRWSYSDTPSTRAQDRAAWQPLYAVPEREWVGLTLKEREELRDIYEDSMSGLISATEAALKAKNHD